MQRLVATAATLGGYALLWGWNSPLGALALACVAVALEPPRPGSGGLLVVERRRL